MKYIKQTKNIKEIKLEEKNYEVWVLMKNYNVWHKDKTCRDLETAKSTCERLEKECKCYTEIHLIKKETRIYRRYKQITK